MQPLSCSGRPWCCRARPILHWWCWGRGSWRATPLPACRSGPQRRAVPHRTGGAHQLPLHRAHVPLRRGPGADAAGHGWPWSPQVGCSWCFPGGAGLFCVPPAFSCCCRTGFPSLLPPGCCSRTQAVFSMHAPARCRQGRSCGLLQPLQAHGASRDHALHYCFHFYLGPCSAKLQS